jgi:hypothetical protein
VKSGFPRDFDSADMPCGSKSKDTVEHHLTLDTCSLLGSLTRSIERMAGQFKNK